MYYTLFAIIYKIYYILYIIYCIPGQLGSLHPLVE